MKLFASARPYVLALSAASLLATSAYSADLPDSYQSYKDSPPAIVPVPNWAGFYIGGHIGGGWGGDSQSVSVNGGDGGGGGGGGGDNNWKNNASDLALKNGDDAVGRIGGRGGNFGQFAPGDKHVGGDGGNGGLGGKVSGESGDDDGLVGGVHLGYNWQYNNIVYGLEGDASLKGGLDNYLASLRARLGVAHNDALFYVTGGLAIRDGDGSDAIGLATDGGSGGDGGQNDDGLDDSGEVGHAASRGGLGGDGAAGGSASMSGFGSDDGGSDTGVVVGAGVEYKLSSNVSAGVEGLWYSFDEGEDLTVVRARLTLHLHRAPYESFKDDYLPENVANWSGFYAGVNAGVGFGSGQHVDSIKTANGGNGQAGGGGGQGHVLGTGAKPPSDGTDDPGGAGGGGGGGSAALISLDDNASGLGGIHLGYNWQSGSRVFGIEGDADWSDSSFRDYLASIRFRLGHSFDRVLVYGTAGVAFAKSSEGLVSVALSSGQGNDGGALNGGDGKYENDPAYTAGDGPGGVGGPGGEGGKATLFEDEGESKIGFVVGGGFELKLSQHTSFGVEGLYYGFDGGDAVATSSSYEAGDDLSTAVIRGRLTFHLDGEQDSLK